MAVWARSGREPDALANAPRLPHGCERLWQDFADLHECRGSNGFGPMRITYADIDAWQRINRVSLEAWEIAAVRKADTAFLTSFAAQHKGKTDG